LIYKQGVPDLKISPDQEKALILFEKAKRMDNTNAIALLSTGKN